MNNSYWNYEDDENIICPYCGKDTSLHKKIRTLEKNRLIATQKKRKPTLATNVARNSPCMDIRQDGNITQKPLTEKQQMKKYKNCRK